MIKAQQVRDRKILDLVTAMEETYSLAISVSELKKDEMLQDIINQILRQTIECGYFIQEYTRRNFGGMCRPLLREPKVRLNICQREQLSNLSLALTIR